MGPIKIKGAPFSFHSEERYQNTITLLISEVLGNMADVSYSLNRLNAALDESYKVSSLSPSDRKAFSEQRFSDSILNRGDALAKLLGNPDISSYESLLSWIESFIKDVIYSDQWSDTEKVLEDLIGRIEELEAIESERKRKEG
jgi:hypothetical protein